MKKCDIVLVGVGGYGTLYPELYIRFPQLYGDIACVAGIVDPYAKAAPCCGWAMENGIPIFDTLEEFYLEHTADLAVISTPIGLHKGQCLTALAHDSHGSGIPGCGASGCAMGGAACYLYAGRCSI